MGIFLALYLTGFIYHSLFGLLECLFMSKSILTVNIFKQGCRYHKLRKTFTKFYLFYDFVSKFDTGLKSFLKQGLSEPESYGDLMYKFKKIVGRTDFSDHFRKILIQTNRIQHECYATNCMLGG